MANKIPIVAIVGRANVGKSSLFNTIIGYREAITADEPGTTRDSISAKASHKNHDFWLVDTAGYKDPSDDFEMTIQDQILQAAENADLIVVVVEANIMITEEDRRIAKMALKTKKPVILAINKSDKKGLGLDEFKKLGISRIIPTSATQKTGIKNLLDEIVSNVPKAIIKASNLIKIAILGRPNVGKSMLFNTLAKKQQAIVADRAGTTRDLNRTSIKYHKQEIELIDTAGIRRSGKIESGVEHFSVLRSIAAINQADVALLLLDANELGVQLDQKIAGMVKNAGRGLVLVVSKWDSVAKKDGYTGDIVLSKVRQEFEFTPWAPLIFTSSVTGQNVTRIFELCQEIMVSRQQKITTPILNKWLQNAMASHPPAGLKNSFPKLKYITQTNESTPTFKIFGRDTKLLHWSYQRYLEKQLRQTFGFEGTPIFLDFIDKQPDYTS